MIKRDLDFLKERLAHTLRSREGVESLIDLLESNLEHLNTEDKTCAWGLEEILSGLRTACIFFDSQARMYGSSISNKERN